MRTLALGALVFFGCLGGGSARAQDSATADPPAAERAVEHDEPRSTEPAPGSRGAVWPWAVVAVGGAMIVAAAVTGALTLVRQGELDATCSPHSCPPSVEAAQAEGRIMAFTTDALGVGGLVVGVAGVVLAVALPSEPAAPVSATAACGPAGCMLEIGGSF